MSKEPGGLLVGGAGVMGHKPHTLGPEAPLQSGGSLGGKCSSAAGKALPRPRGCLSAESARAGTAALTIRGFGPQRGAAWRLRRRLCSSGAAWLPELRPAVHSPTASSLASLRNNSSTPILWQVQPWLQAGLHSVSASAFSAEQAWDPSTCLKFDFQFRAVLSHNIILLQPDLNFEALSGKLAPTRPRTSSWGRASLNPSLYLKKTFSPNLYSRVLR